MHYLFLKLSKWNIIILHSPPDLQEYTYHVINELGVQEIRPFRLPCFLRSK
jgi:hypothetical protein